MSPAKRPRSLVAPVTAAAPARKRQPLNVAAAVEAGRENVSSVICDPSDGTFLYGGGEGQVMGMTAPHWRGTWAKPIGMHCGVAFVAFAPWIPGAFYCDDWQGLRVVMAALVATTEQVPEHTITPDDYRAIAAAVTADGGRVTYETAPGVHS